MDVTTGTTIRITATLPKPINEYVNVIIYCFTNSLFPIKFSYNKKEGYGTIDDTGKIILLGGITSKMSGKLQYQIFLDDNDNPTTENKGNNGIDTGINLVYTLISKEA